MTENIEKLVVGDSKEKKRIANSTFSRKTRGKGGMVTALNMMSREEKREYTKTIDGPSYNMYEQIIPASHLSQLPQDIRLRCWIKWNEIYYIEDIMKVWSIQTFDELENFLEELQLPIHMVLKEVELIENKRDSSQEPNFYLTLNDLMADENSTPYIYDFSGVYESKQVILQLQKIINDLVKFQNNYEVQIKVKVIDNE